MQLAIEFIEYGKAMSGPLDFRELAYTSRMQGSALSILNNVVIEPQVSNHDETSFWNAIGNYSIAVLPYLERNAHILIEVQRRNESERADIRAGSGRPYNQVRMTQVNSGAILKAFRLGKAVYTSIVSYDKHLPWRLQDHNQANRVVEPEQIELISADAFSAAQLGIQNTSGRYVHSLLYPEVGKLGSQVVIPPHLLEDIALAILSDRRVIISDSRLSIAERLAICEAVQLILGDLLDRVITFSLHYVTKHPVDLIFLSSNDRYTSQGASKSAVSFSTEEATEASLKEKQNKASFNLLERIELAAENNHKGHWTSFVNGLIECMNPNRSTDELKLYALKGQIHKSKLLEIMISYAGSLSDATVFSIFNDSDWVVDPEDRQEHRGFLIGRVLSRSQNDIIAQITKNYLSSNCNLLDLLDWITKDNVQLSDVARFDRLLSQPTIDQLEKWLASNSLYPLVGIILAGEGSFSFGNGVDLLKWIVENLRYDTQPFISKTISLIVSQSIKLNKLTTELLISGRNVPGMRHLYSDLFLTEEQMLEVRKQVIEDFSHSLHSLTDIEFFVSISHSLYASALKESSPSTKIGSNVLLPLSSEIFESFRRSASEHPQLQEVLLFRELALHAKFLLSLGISVKEKLSQIEKQFKTISPLFLTSVVSRIRVSGLWTLLSEQYDLDELTRAITYIWLIDSLIESNLNGALQEYDIRRLQQSFPEEILLAVEETNLKLLNAYIDGTAQLQLSIVHPELVVGLYRM